MLLNIHVAFLLKLIQNPARLPKIFGVSDGYLMETILTKIYRSNYKNHHYHQEPRLDITRVPSSLLASADIVSCTEVLEHVAPPIDTAFEGLYEVLKESGVLILSVPHTDELGVHVEHFPVMIESQIKVLDGVSHLEGFNLEGQCLKFYNLVFHGGKGFTLEYRIFSEQSLKGFLNEANFMNIRKNRNVRFFGINWEPWSRVWIAHKPS
jgi:SAM-dependent methyltransferase